MEQKLVRMKELVAILSEAAKAYYQESREIMANFEYDKLYDELTVLEKETGMVLSGRNTFLEIRWSYHCLDLRKWRAFQSSNQRKRRDRRSYHQQCKGI